MKLRNAHLAVVDRTKVFDYLLNEAHPDNGGKSAMSGQTQESRQWSIRTVWIIDRGEDAPRLVTAYPGKE